MGRKKGIPKEPCRLRQKALKGGNVSLYLDIYLQGQRSYEFLRLYLIPERNDADRAHNANIMQIAQQIKSQRVVELQAEQAGAEITSPATLFYPYFDAIAEQRKGSTRRRWQAVSKFLRAYDGRSITFRQVTARWVDGWLQHLEGAGLADNSRHIYLQTLRTCLREAVRAGIISRDPTAGIKTKVSLSERQYLTMDELRRFAAVGCDPPNERVRRAFVFSALTGLRYSDICRLTRDNVQRDEQGRPRLVYTQQKTGKRETLDITEQALSLVSAGDLLFPLPSNSVTNNHIRAICDAAHITKHITFHSARHTFATMMLTLGNDIYVVSKLLGHSSVKITQVYAKVLDDAKRKAVDTIPDLLTE